VDDFVNAFENTVSLFWVNEEHYYDTNSRSCNLLMRVHTET